MSFVISVTEADDGTQVPSGYPQKNRGLYFDGASEAYVKITGVHLHQIWSIHLWILRSEDTSTVCLFSKDRGDSNSAQHSIKAFLDGSDKKLYVEISADTDHT